MGFRIPAVLVSPYARRGHVDHSIYGFESILKMIRYRYGLPPLTPRDLYANNIAAAFDFDSKPNYAIPNLPTPTGGDRQRRAPARPRSTAAAPASTTALLGAPPGTSSRRLPERARAHAGGDAEQRYLERLGFRYKPATPATMYRHPSKLGMHA